MKATNQLPYIQKTTTIAVHPDEHGDFRYPYDNGYTGLTYNLEDALEWADVDPTKVRAIIVLEVE